MNSGLRLLFFGVALSCSTATYAVDPLHPSSLVPPISEALYYYGSAGGGERRAAPYIVDPSLSIPESSVIPVQCWGNNRIGAQGTLSQLTFFYKTAHARHACPSATDATAVYPCTVGLRAYMVLPPNHRFDSGQKKPVAVFFHGGAWQQGTPMAYLHQAYHLASLGIPSVTFQYRIASTHDRAQMLGYDDYLSREESTMDAKSAVRWIRKNATHFGFDSQNIISIGGSAGGHLALAGALSDPSISDEPLNSGDGLISSGANWMIPLFPVGAPTLVGLGGSDETRASGSAFYPAPNISYARAKKIDPYVNVSRATATKGMMLISGFNDVHPLTPPWTHTLLVNAYNKVKPDKGEWVLIPGAVHDFMSAPDSATQANGFETGMAFIDDYLIRKNLMVNWSGGTTTADRVRWFQYVQDPAYSSDRYGYNRTLCGADNGTPSFYNYYAFHGFGLTDPASGFSTPTYNGRVFQIWNVTQGGLW